jgi:6-phosphofructokinase 1
MGFPVVGVPGSIDNDLWGTDHAIGVDTALNVILATVDRLRDTADAMGRAFLVEVMGRHAGYLAALSGMTCGAEMVAIPREHSTHDGFIAAVRAQMHRARARGKSHFILILAEGLVKDDLQTTTSALEELLQGEYAQGRLPYEPRSLVVGYQQRGGVATHCDRRLATELGAAAAERLRDGTSGVMVGQRGERVVDHPLHEVLEMSGRPLTNLDHRVLDLSRILAT